MAFHVTCVSLLLMVGTQSAIIAGLPLPSSEEGGFEQSLSHPDDSVTGIIEVVNRAYRQLDMFEIDIPLCDKTVKKLLADLGKKQNQTKLPHHQVAGDGLSRTEGAGVQSSLLWPAARVPYAFAAFLSNAGINAALSAMNHWMNKTCIQFVPRTDNDSDYVIFVEYSGCWSYVGRQGGPQMVSIGDTSPAGQTCKQTGAVVHELGHALGLWHEQSRPDRDLYVKIQWSKVWPGADINFLKYSRDLIPAVNQYDYESIMHYSSTAFSIDGSATIIPLLNGVTRMGQRTGLSPLDIQMANSLYNCPTASPMPIVEAVENHGEVPPAALDMDTFHIRNGRYCLAADESRAAGLFEARDAILVPCNRNAPSQLWQWTPSHQLINVVHFLCLTGAYFLRLEVCLSNFSSTQQWRCAEAFITQPATGKCLTLNQPLREVDASLEDALELAISGDGKYYVSLETCNVDKEYQKWTAEIGGAGRSAYVCHDTLEHRIAQCDTIRAGAGPLMGWTLCEPLGYYARGLAGLPSSTGGQDWSGTAPARAGAPDVFCCASSHVFAGLALGPAAISSEECKLLETQGDEGAFACPQGMFLKGLYYGSRKEAVAAKVVRCCRPDTAALAYEHCFTDVLRSGSADGVLSCPLTGYSIAAMRTTMCAGGGCAKMVTCCR